MVKSTKQSPQQTNLEKGSQRPDNAKGKMADNVKKFFSAASQLLGKNRLQSVGFKLFIFIFVSIVACVAAVGALAYMTSKSLVKEKVSQASLQTINQLGENLEDFMDTFENISLQIYADQEYRQHIRTLEEQSDILTRFKATTAIGDKLRSYVLVNPLISGAILLPVDSKLPPIAVGNSSIDRAEKLMATDWFAKSVELDGMVHWIRPSAEGLGSSSSNQAIGLSRMIKDPNSGKPKYVLLIDIYLRGISDRYDGINLGEDSQVFIIDNDGNYVSAMEDTLIGEPGHVAVSDEAIEEGVTATGDDVLVISRPFEGVDWKLAASIPVNELVKDAQKIANFTWLMILCAVVIAILIGVRVIITIGSPLIQLQELMVKGAKGNLTVRSTITNRKDEIGQLSTSFNEMMANIADLAVQTTRSAADVLRTAGELTDSSRKTALSAKEISIATEEIANGASSLATEAEKGSDLTQSINTQMQNVIDANKQMVHSAVEVQQSSGEGTKYMAALIEKTGLTEEMTRSMVEKVDALKESTGSIVKILDVLNNVTKQTNILSLNATIEAARAGAAGKGFMVVADEIRQLADQSRQSIDVVGQITHKIQSEIEETVKVLSDAYPLFQEQIGSVKEANQIFLSVQGEMVSFVQSLDHVTESIGELDQSQAVLAEAMSNVSAVAQQSSATSEEVASLSSEQLNISDNLVTLSERLDAVSQELKASLSRFKIE